MPLPEPPPAIGGDAGPLAACGAFRAVHRRRHLLHDEVGVMRKPMVLAAQGPFLGAGPEIARSADFPSAMGTARFPSPEVTLGLIAAVHERVRKFLARPAEVVRGTARTSSASWTSARCSAARADPRAR
jgi:enoyl-CoA hydratase/carnithine racemase